MYNIYLYTNLQSIKVAFKDTTKWDITVFETSSKGIYRFVSPFQEDKKVSVMNEDSLV